jgi:hypothetical protein
VPLSRIVRALGGELYAGGRRASVPAPGHSASDRSVSLLVEGDRVVVHSFAGDDWRAVLADLFARGLVDRGGRLVGAGDGGGLPGAGLPGAGLGAAAREAIARALWEAAAPVEGTLAEDHCRRRAIGRVLSPELRSHAGVPAAAYADIGPRRPALLAAIRDSFGTLRGVELTYLAANGERARVRTPRKTIGRIPRGAAVRLDPPGARLLVAEGVFTALSASERLGLPAWALLSADNLRRWRPPAEVQSVVVAADRGRVGEAAALALTAALRAAGVRTEVCRPPAGCGDWNEAAQAEGRRKGGEGRAEPAEGLPDGPGA